MKRLLIFAVFLLSNYAFASSNVLGRVVQQKGEQAVEMATIQLFHATSTDSSFVKGVQTNTDGDFIFDNIPSGKYKLLVSCIGYQQNFLYITITDTTLLLPTIRLKEDVQFLSEVTVQGHAAEMTVKGDTIEYNTAAYKMHENAMVEDLLKKMYIRQNEKYLFTKRKVHKTFKYEKQRHSKRDRCFFCSNAF